MSNKQKRSLFQILPFGVIPAIFSLVQSILEKGILGDYPEYPSTGNPYQAQFFIPAILSLGVGLLIGAFDVFYVDRWFQDKSFSRKVIFKSVVYTFAIVLATLLIIVAGHTLSQGKSPFSGEVREYVLSFFGNFAFWSIMCYYSLAIIISSFYKEVSDSMGQAVSLNIFSGKYHQPTVEERVFMFLDMKSSTTYAEQLGHIRYFQMLKEYYGDLSDPIVDHGGEIYQYVGDEIVITWRLKEGFAREVVGSFFVMKRALGSRRDHYLAKYGVMPTFKAGIHYGQVTTGEIGVIKKDIAFSGDILNTTARIQSLCNTYAVDLLASERFIRALKVEAHYEVAEIGEVQLRGKEQTTSLFTIREGDPVPV